ncbi:MAG: SGNH/GDSL hydrolase family protein [Clostridiales bacterium]|nr:SGNH/GDSL hydrolase family protein [Clostridiales bacterium]
MILNANERIVFAGDSVTDDGRARPIGEGLFDGTGNGFVRLVEMFLTVDYPDLNIRCTNMGVSGNTSRDLLARWDTDVTALKPDRVVLCIGINDVWRQFDAPQCPDFTCTPEEYEANINAMADKTDAKIIFMTPYFLESNTNDPMRKRMDKYGAIVKKIAKERGCPCVDLQAAFSDFLKHRHSTFITWDRVHPGKFGSLIIARALLRELGYEFK